MFIVTNTGGNRKSPHRLTDLTSLEWSDILSLFYGQNNAMKVAYKVWLDHRGKAFGDGPHELLKRVDRTKSLHRAANQMGMAYSNAWRLILTIEKRLGFALIERKVGGRSGGGSRVTPRGKELMKQYRLFQKEVKTSLERIYRLHFSSRR
jgi:molybdate transport system regulatory protein